MTNVICKAGRRGVQWDAGSRPLCVQQSESRVVWTHRIHKHPPFRNRIFLVNSFKMTAMNRAMVVAGIATMFQAGGQILLTSLMLLQFFCVIDFLRELPVLLFLKILFFTNTDSCDARITVGTALDGVPNQAFVLLNSTPLTALRTFYINSVNLGLGTLWLLSSFGLMRGGAESKETKSIRWPWIIITIAVCGVDLVATVTFVNDTFHTRTLSELVDYIGATTSGFGNTEVNTSMVSWVMVMIYSRFIFFFIMNLVLIVAVVIQQEAKRALENTGVQVEARTVTTDTGTLTNDVERQSERSSTPPAPLIPRPGLSQSFRRMKARLFNRELPLPDRTRNVPRVELDGHSSDDSPERSPQTQHVGIDKKRTVNFTQNMVSVRDRLENLIAEQQRRLDRAVVDTSGRRSPPRASQSLPHLDTAEQDTRGIESGVSGQDSLNVYLDGEAQRRSSRGSSPGRTFPPRRTACETTSPLTRIYRQFRSRTTRPSLPFERLPSTEQLQA